MKIFIAALALVAITSFTPAQFMLTTTLAAGNGQNGAMFDITNISGALVTITSFDQGFFAAGTATLYEVYTVTAGTSFVGNETNAGAWTLQGSTMNVAHPTPAVAVAVRLPLP